MTDIYSVPVQVWQKFWDRSFPMREAYVQFQMPEIRQRYAKLHKEGGPQHSWKLFQKVAQDKEAMSELSKEQPTTIGFWDGIGRIVEVMNNAQTEEYKKANEAYTALDKELQDCCSRWLNSGRMIATGFAPDRRPQDLATVVPADLVSRGYLNWTKNSIYHDTLKMVDVRIGVPEWLEELLDEFHNSKRYIQLNAGKVEKDSRVLESPDCQPGNSGSKVGRASRKSEISEAYYELLAYGEIQTADPIKSIAFPIREFILRKNPDDPRGRNGLSDETIRRVVREVQQTQN